MKFPVNVARDIVKFRWQGPLGPMIIAATGRGIAGVWFDGQKHMPDHSQWREDEAHAHILAAMEQLGDYFAGKRSTFDLPLDLAAGTPFQQSVWRALLSIPHGATTNYGALSRDIGAPSAARAVGAAVGRNPVSIVVPCHRVLGSGGALTGYAGGLDRKTALLKLEGVL
jgi:methylated-DNA-[protein]-cysteine S-methyltransferase